MGLQLAVYNHKRLVETHDERMEVYRRRKRLKNEALKRYFEAVQRNDFKI